MVARLVIAGTSSGAGKTTVATGLIAALAKRGDRPAPFKVGPDFIDPSYHALAAGRPGRNLAAFLSGPELIAAADLVSEVVKVKHPMDAGIRAQQGIEW